MRTAPPCEPDEALLQPSSHRGAEGPAKVVIASLLPTKVLLTGLARLREERLR